MLTVHGMLAAAGVVALSVGLTAAIVSWVWVVVERIDSLVGQGIAICLPVVLGMWLAAAWAFS